MFKGFLALDKTVFPPKPNAIRSGEWERMCAKNGATPFCDINPEYWQQFYRDNRDGLFILVDNSTGNIIGSLCANFISDTHKDGYINGFVDFEQITKATPTVGGSNNLLISNMALLQEHRNKDGIKALGAGLVNWLSSLAEQGIKPNYAFAEAGSSDGANSLTRGFGMVPIDKDDLDFDGGGMYHSPDALQSYIAKMKTWQVNKIATQGDDPVIKYN